MKELNSKRNIRVGVAGFVDESKFNKQLAGPIIERALDAIAAEYYDCNISIVSGLANVGVIGLAYAVAVKRNWRTVGVACAEVLDHEWFPVDSAHVIGQTWGDESEFFLKSIDLLVTFGGGDQTKDEAKRAREMGKTVRQHALPVK